MWRQAGGLPHFLRQMPLRFSFAPCGAVGGLETASEVWQARHAIRFLLRRGGVTPPCGWGESPTGTRSAGLLSVWTESNQRTTGGRVFLSPPPSGHPPTKAKRKDYGPFLWNLFLGEEGRAIIKLRSALEKRLRGMAGEARHSIFIAAGWGHPALRQNLRRWWKRVVGTPTPTAG